MVMVSVSSLDSKTVVTSKKGTFHGSSENCPRVSESFNPFENFEESSLESRYFSMSQVIHDNIENVYAISYHTNKPWMAEQPQPDSSPESPKIKA